MKTLSFKHTLSACFIAYMVQATVCNFAPLLFVGWSNEFDIDIPKLTTIITVTFLVQIIIDLASAKFAEQIGYKKCLVVSHLCSAAGYILLGTLPYLVNNAYLGIIISIILYSIGSGLLEVLISPVVESCPTDNKAGAMSLLHSFYCWGTVFVIGVSTLYFIFFGRDNWKYLSFFWAIFALLNGIFFCFVPIKEPKLEVKEKSDKTIFKNKFFLFALLLMICSGASEIAMSQWASAFAETALKVSKTVGDIAGPMAFAILMGIGRIVFSKLSSKINIERYLVTSAIICIVSYLIACLSNNAILSLMGCALCGFSVSAMWPGTISLTSKTTKSTSTLMYALLAVSGDIGCTTGPTVIGWVTNSLNNNLKQGLLFGTAFPILFIIALALAKKSKIQHKQ